MKLLLTILLFLTTSLMVVSQSFEFNEITLEDGISSDEVTCVHQDIYGFIWFGTANGLNRFDGENFVQYKNDFNNEKSISNNFIWSITSDQDSNLWIGTKSGLNRYITKKDHFERYLYMEGNPSKNSIRDLLVDHKGRLWVCSGYGLRGMMKNQHGGFEANEYFPDFEFKDSIRKQEWAFMTIVEDVNHQLWTGSWGGGLMLFQPEEGIFECYRHNPEDISSISSDLITTIKEMPDGKLWVGTFNRGLNLFDPVSGKFENYRNNLFIKQQLNANERIMSILCDKKQRNWIGTGNSLFIFNEGLEKRLFARTGDINKSKEFSLVKDLIYDIYEDNAGLIWIASGSGGVDLYDTQKDKFSKYYRKLGKGGFRNFIKQIENDEKGNLWIATFGDGLVYANKEGDVIKRIRQPEIKSDLVNVIYLHKNKLFCGTVNGLSVIQNPSETNHAIMHLEAPVLTNATIRSILIPKDNNVWIIADDNVIKLSLDGYETVEDKKDYSSLIRVPLGMQLDNNDNAVIYGRGGMVIEDPIKHTRTKLNYLPNDIKNGLCNNEVLAVQQDHQGNYWIGTMAGLTKYNKNEKLFTHYFEKDGLASQKITDLIVVDDEPWILSKSALMHIDQRGVIKNYYRSDGLFINSSTISKTKNQSVYIGSEGGFYHFTPSDIKINKLKPDVYFTGLWINGVKKEPDGKLLNKNILQTESIVVNYSEKVLRFSFAALNYTMPEKNNYQYKLVGYDTSWNNLETRNELTLMNLNPGKYALMVRGSNNDKIWSDKPAIMHIKVLPPWWRSWKMILASFVIMTMILFLWRMFIVKKERIISEMKSAKEINQLKLKFFTNISHEIRTPLTLILGPANSLLTKEKLSKTGMSYADSILRNAQRLLNLVNQVMDFRKIDAGEFRLNPSKTNVKQFIDDLLKSYSFESEKKKLNIKLVTKVENEGYAYIDKIVLDNILTNLISNAIKYTPENGTITVSVSWINGDGHVETKSHTKKLEIRVADTGIGIEPEETERVFNRFFRSQGIMSSKIEGTGIGLHYVKEMVNLHKGDIKVLKNQPKGSVFVVSLPVLVDDGIYAGTKYVAVENEYHYNNEKEGVKKRNDLQILENLENKQVILVVEDGDEMRGYISDILYHAGFEVITAEDGEEGVKKTFEFLPDLVISDIMMPIKDGIEMCNELKSASKTSYIPVILLTAKTLVEDQLEGYKTGADAYLTKPFDENLLITVVGNVFTNRELIRKHVREQLLENDERNVNINKPKEEPQIKDIHEFIHKVKGIIEQEYQDDQFNTEKLATKLLISRRHFTRKFTNLTGYNPSDFIREYRLMKARQIIKNTSDLHINEVGFKVGFKNASHFTQCYKERFGVTPSEDLS